MFSFQFFFLVYVFTKFPLLSHPNFSIHKLPIFIEPQLPLVPLLLSTLLLLFFIHRRVFDHLSVKILYLALLTICWRPMYTIFLFWLVIQLTEPVKVVYSLAFSDSVVLVIWIRKCCHRLGSLNLQSNCSYPSFITIYPLSHPTIYPWGLKIIHPRTSPTRRGRFLYPSRKYRVTVW